MDLTISAALEKYLQSSLTENLCIVLFIIWGAWLCWVLCQLENIRFLGRQINRLLIWSHGIMIPLTLTALLPFVFKNTFIEHHIPEIIRYVVPIITFVLGNYAARHRNEVSKQRRYRKALISLHEEASQNLALLADDFRFLEIDTNDLQRLGNDYAPAMVVFPCVSRFLEIFLDNAIPFWNPSSLTTKANDILNAIRCLNKKISDREDILKNLQSPEVEQGNRTNKLEEIESLNGISMENIRNLQLYLLEFQQQISTALTKKGIQFSDLIEF